MVSYSHYIGAVLRDPRSGRYCAVHEEQGIRRYTILTTEANDSMRPVHDRMPVMIGRDEIRSWIRDTDRLSEFLSRPQVQLVCEQDSGQIRMEFV